MYNSGRRGKRAPDGYGIISVNEQFNQTEYPIPIINSYAVTDGSYVPTDDLALNTAGGQTVVIYGSGFKSGIVVNINGTNRTTTLLDSGRLAITSPALSSGTYTIYASNSDGATAVYVPGLIYSGTPTWSTSTNLGSRYEANTYSQTLVATSDSSVTYSLQAGSNLPSGVTLTSGGQLSGTLPAESGSTTYTFTVVATDAELQDTTRQFSLTVNTDVVTWSTPSSNYVISSYEYAPLSNVTASATSAGGYGMLYTANTIPTGATLNTSSGLISGTINTVGNTYSRLTATANTSTRSATRDVIFNVNQDVVSWTTPTANQVISAYEYSAISNVTANAASAAGFGVLYSANTIPTGITINPSTGLISGTANTTGNTYSRLTATANTTTRSNTQDVIFNIQQDVVTWSSPADATAYSLVGGTAMANVTMAASSAAGRTITYTANALPSGVSITGNTIYGTPDTAQTVYTLLTATSATTNRTATRTISWTISIGDTYWKNTTLLLNGATSANTFINDLSLNNNQLTIAGDTRPSNFNPYQEGYYSNYFDGTGDYLTCLPGTFGSNDFTIEFWVYSNISTDQTLFNNINWYGGYTAGSILIHYTSGQINGQIYTGGGSDANYAPTTTLSTTTTIQGKWNHITMTRTGGYLYLGVNGVVTSAAITTNNGLNLESRTTYAIGAWSGNSGGPANALSGYISNFRILNGTALYTTNYTVPTAPLSLVSNTKLLTCQSNRLIDNSVNKFTITKVGDTTVSSAHPFTTPTTSSYNTAYSTYFDGNGDYLSTASGNNLTLNGDFTIECWVYFKSIGAGYQVILSSDTNSHYFAVTQSLIDMNFGADTNYSTGGVPFFTTNSWTHLAATRSSNTVRFFVNGVLKTPTTNPTNSTTGFMTGPMTIGGWSSGATQSVNGYISNLRVIKGTALYTSAFTPPTSALTAVAGTVLLTCMDPTFKDNSANNMSLSVTGNTVPVIASPFTMTTANTTVTSLGSAYFDGTGDYLTVAGGSSLALGTNDFTIQFWVNLNVAPTADVMFYEGRNGANGVYPLIYWRNSAAKIYYFVNSTDAIISGSVPAASLVGTWTHIAVARKSSVTKMFINGIQAGSDYVDSNNYLNSGNYPLIGYNSTNPGGYVNGYMSDVQVVKGTALYTANFLPPQAPQTPVANTALLTLQTNGGATNNGFVDQSSFNNIITRAGNTTQGTFSPYSQNGWSNYFDGTGDYLTFAGNPVDNLSTGTIECWVNIPSNTAQWIFTKQHDSVGTNFALSIGSYISSVGTATSGTAGIIYWHPRNSAGLNAAASNSVVPLNTWTHIAVVFSSSNCKIYINGTLDSTTSGDYSNQTPDGSPTYTAIGAGAATNSNFTGYISNFRFNNTAVYTSNFTPSTTPLTAISGTLLLTCQSNRLIDNSPNNFTITKAGDTSVQAYSPFGGITSVPASYSNYFDGTGDYLTYGSSSVFTFGTGDFTVEAWIYLTASANFGILGVGGAGAGSYGFYYDSSNLKLQSTRYGDTAGAGVTTSTLSLNTWYHVAAVRINGTAKIYINGTVDSGATYSMGNVTATGADTGRIWQGASVAAGYISNLRVIKGTGLYTTNFTPSTTPLTTTSQGATASQISLLTCQSSTMVDNSTNYFALTANGDVKPRPFNPFGLTNTTNVSYSPSVNGGSMYFDGTGDYLTNTTTDVSCSGNFTFECWVYKNSSVGTDLFKFGSEASGRASIGIDSSNNFFYNFYGVGNVNLGTVLNNAWYHVAMVRSGTTVTAYVNGISTGTSTTSTTFGNVNGFSFGVSMNGYLSDARLTKGIALYTSNFYPGTAPLTPTTTIGANTYTSTLYLTGTSGGIVDAHGTVNLETVGDTKLAPEDPYAGSYYSNYFDGTGDALTVASNAVFGFGTGDFTIELWMNIPSWTSDAQFIGCHTAFVGFDWLVQYYSSNLRWLDSSLTLNTGVTPAVNQWHHFAVTRSGTTLRIFLDGAQIASGTSTANIGATKALGIMGDSTAGATQIGYVSNVRIVKGTALYTSAFTPSTTPLTAISGTSLLTCQSNSFKDNSTNNFTITRNGDTKVKSMNPFQQNTGKSLYFDGTGDYLSVPSNPNLTFGTGNFTVEMWVYQGTLAAATLSDFRGAINNVAPSFELNSSGKLVIYKETVGTLITSTSSITAGSWNHVAYTRSGTTVRLFINGTLDATTATDSTNWATPTTKMTVGSNYTGGGYLNGYIKDLRVTKGVARYTTTFTPPTSAFEVK